MVSMLVQPETVLGWHRELVRRKWAAFGRRRGPGRPRLDPELQRLVVKMAKDNPKWGCGPSVVTGKHKPGAVVGAAC